MKLSSTVLMVLAAVIALGSYFCLFTVNERELGVRLRFGEIIAADYEAGLHFKLPWDNVRKYPRRLLTINNPQEPFLTKEKKNLYVDFFVKWKITDVSEFYRASSGEAAIAAQRLLELVLIDGHEISCRWGCFEGGN